MTPRTPLRAVLDTRREDLLEDWIEYQQRTTAIRTEPLSEADLRDQSARVLELFSEAVATGRVEDVQGEEWGGVRASLEELARSREGQGFSPTETTSFMLSLRRPLFERAAEVGPDDPAALADDLAAIARLLEQLALFTTEIFLQAREETIRRQQEELMELSTPVISLWEGVLAVPLIGTLDSARTQMVTEALLQRIVEKGATVAIIDITGVPAVDTLVAQHLIKTISAARLMGTECIISGIRPQIAQTMVDLGIEFEQIRTRGSLGDAMKLALREAGWSVARPGG